MSRKDVSLLAAAWILAGCRSGSEKQGRDAGPSAPTMPPGMLVPSDAPPATPAAASGLRPARRATSGPWAELQIAPAGDRADRKEFQHWRDDSLYVPLPVMMLLHGSFGRALRGFDMFLPRLFAGEALVRLAEGLEGFATTASPELAATAREIAVFARGVSAQGKGLWVLTE